MVFEWISYFDCGACGTVERADAVGYDSLGYPECPGCGARTGPLVGAGATETGTEALD
ncbi:hypothetical protein [Halogeometricum luteum]|uniref:Small CPxCG-related zinc finger protein n=1 Tax=Halogeometricum luteum TaxID=2950537 RepID=A0ABU2FXD5_9EURY|nr:hypothetical protein [Halogeometricum sp. S3BR5-2]MDS0293197.1 hypothetical protein [Halogeometricum sp. S3BR5-2]